jgi:hypothetical protein
MAESISELESQILQLEDHVLIAALNDQLEAVGQGNLQSNVMLMSGRAVREAATPSPLHLAFG